MSILNYTPYAYTTEIHVFDSPLNAYADLKGKALFKLCLKKTPNNISKDLLRIIWKGKFWGTIKESHLNLRLQGWIP